MRVFFFFVLVIRDSGNFFESSEFRVFRYVMVHEKPDGDERFSEQNRKRRGEQLELGLVS